MNYARYFIPQLFPDLSGRIVFIDDDCIVQGKKAKEQKMNKREQ